MSFRPGLTASQYRSLIANSTAATAAAPTLGGSGKLDLRAAFDNTLAAYPSALSLRPDTSHSLTLSNTGTQADTFSISAVPANGGANPNIDTTVLTLGPGESQTVHASLSPDGTGERHGVIEISGTKTSVVTRIPYWMGVAGSETQYIALLTPVDQTEQYFGEEVWMVVRLTDAAGLPFAGELPTVETRASRAQILEVASIGTIPGTYLIRVRVGRGGNEGINVFTISSGQAKRDVTFLVR